MSQYLTWFILHLITVGRFRFSARQVSSYQNVLKWSGHVMVSAARCTFGLYWILHAHRHVGCGLHFLRNGLRPASISRVHSRGRTTPNIQGDLSYKTQFFAYFHELFFIGARDTYRRQLAWYFYVWRVTKLPFSLLPSWAFSQTGASFGLRGYWLSVQIPPLRGEKAYFSARGHASSILRISGHWSSQPTRW